MRHLSLFLEDIPGCFPEITTENHQGFYPKIYLSSFPKLTFDNLFSSFVFTEIIHKIHLELRIFTIIPGMLFKPRVN